MNSSNSDTNRPAEISAALQPAYANASKLKLSKAEIKALTKPFPDNQIEILPTGSIYLPHIFLSKRLNQVFGPGAWSLICRDHYIDEDARAIYAEHVLIIRGCIIGESVGDRGFNELTKKANYGDIVEWLAGQALRRICGKRLSCSAELWEPDYAIKWQSKHAEQYQGESWDSEARIMVPTMLWKKKGSKIVLDHFSESPTQQTKKIKADENLRHVMLQILEQAGKANVLKFAVDNGILTGDQDLNDWPLDRVGVTESEIKMLQRQIEEHLKKSLPAESTGWRTVKIPFGKFKDQTLGEIEKETIGEFWAGIPELTKSPSIAEKNKKFISAINAAAKEFEFSQLKTKK